MVKPVLLVGDEFTVRMQFTEMLEGRKGGRICFYRVRFWPNVDDHAALPVLSIWKERLGWRLTKICAKPTLEATVHRLLMHEKPLTLPSLMKIFIL